MAQHDMNIANQSFPDFRTDLNNSLSAINSMHSGTSRPSGAVAGTLWLDTTNSGSNSLTVKFYDGSDDITFATINTSANTVDFSDSSIDTVTFKEAGTNFTNSLLLGHSTTGTLSSAEKNIGIGVGTLNALTSADNNIAIGYNALTALNAGGGSENGSNIAIGVNAADGITTGYENTVIGGNAGAAWTGSETQNTVLGHNAISASAGGDYNTALGRNALKLVTGQYNISIGYNSGDNITSGSGNVVIGKADVSSATGNQQLKISDGTDGSVNWISGGSDGVVTLNAANVTQQAITSSSNAVAWDASAKPNAYHITTENTTFSAPSNAVEGAFICVEINYNGSHTIAWNTVFEFSASTEPTETATDGKTDIHVFRYNGAVWQEVGRTMNLSES
jgi:hypothetical protein